MPDNLSRRGPEDPKKINIKQPYERQRWAEKLGVTELELELTVIEVGPVVSDVRAWLRKHK